MVDVMDMEDIIREILKKNPYFQDLEIADHVVEFYAEKLIKEVSDFVSSQQHIKCVNCKGYKFKNLKERWQVG